MNCEACGHDNVEGARFCANCGVTIATHVSGDDPLVGKIVGGRYRITGVIGEGGMGIVYEAEQQMGSTVRKVAVKTLHSELSRDPSVTARFHRECGTVAQLEHPNTIKVYDFGAMPDGTLYIAMEYLAGKPLDKVIESSGAIEPKRVLKLLRQISGSLEEAHRMGIVHRDLKPENVILVDRAGEVDVVKLLDFGIAARTESADAEREAKLTQQGMVLGTPPYMSPEQFTGKALDKRSDIYSLAVMAYEMLTGKLPFEASTPWQWATEHMTSQPRPFETMSVSTSIPKPMRDAILRGLAKDRDERFDTVSAFVEAMAASGPADSSTDSARTSAATAAMEAAPDFGALQAGPAPTAAMPAQAPVASPAQPQRIPAPPPAERTGSGGGKGLIYGLGGVAVLLLGGIAYALMQNGDGDEEIDPLIPTETPTVAETAPPPTSDPEPDEQGSAGNSGQAGSPSETLEPIGGTTPPRNPTPNPTRRPTPPDPPPTPPPSDPPAPAGDPCKDCASLAQGGNITGAAAKFQQCGDAAKKAACSARAKRRAPAAAKSARTRQNCAKARQIQAAANSMEAGSAALDAEIAQCN